LVFEPGFDVVTGAFSYTGRFIASKLLDGGRRVRTLTNHPQRPGAQEIEVDVAPLKFYERAALVDSFRGADVFYNTYWVRFHHGGIGFGDAIANTRILMSAAAEAGVRKVVHISVSNPSIDSHLDYYAGKARTEEIVRESGMQWARRAATGCSRWPARMSRRSRRGLRVRPITSWSTRPGRRSSAMPSS